MKTATELFGSKQGGPKTFQDFFWKVNKRDSRKKLLYSRISVTGPLVSEFRNIRSSWQWVSEVFSKVFSRKIAENIENDNDDVWDVCDNGGDLFIYVLASGRYFLSNFARD